MQKEIGRYFILIAKEVLFRLPSLTITRISTFQALGLQKTFVFYLK